MSKHRDDWGLGAIFGACGPEWCNPWWGRGGGPWGYRGRRRRQQMFEAGEVKYVILRLLREKPRHGYEIIKALEEKLGGYYTPSAGTVYPTLQMLEDQGYVKAVEAEGRKVYQLTPEGEAFLDENRDAVEDIVGRVRDTVRDFAGGPIGDLNGAFARLAALTFKTAWRRGPDHPTIARMVDILRQATEQMEKV